MPVTLKLTDLSLPQSWIIPDATINSDGVMTAAMVRMLLAGGSLPDQAGHAGQFLTTNGTNATAQQVTRLRQLVDEELRAAATYGRATAELKRVEQRAGQVLQAYEAKSAALRAAMHEVVRAADLDPDKDHFSLDLKAGTIIRESPATSSVPSAPLSAVPAPKKE